MSDAPTTLKQLAASLGLSQATVSRALNGNVAISTSTRERVAVAAKAAGYQPNQAARRLALGRTNVLGLVFPLERLLQPQTNFVEVLSGLTEAAQARGYDLALSPFTEDEASVYRRLTASRSVDGVVITRPRVHDDRVALLQSLGLPFVVHGRTETRLPYAFADIDNDAVFELPAEYLFGRGHRRIAALNAPSEFRYAFARHRGAMRALRSAGLEAESLLYREAPMTEEAGFCLAGDLLDAPDPPTAIMCGSIFMAKGVYRALANRGLRPGQDVAVTAHNDVVRSASPESFTPSLTTTEAPIRDTGRRLATILIDAVEAISDGHVVDIRSVSIIHRRSA